MKEEATLGKDAGKLVPVAIGGAEPPIGFRRIQAANLDGWSGDKNNPQWQLLLQATRGVVGTSREDRAPSHSPYRPPPAPRRAAPVGIILGALAVAIALGTAAFVIWRPDTASDPLEQVDANVVQESAPAKTAEVPNSTNADSVEPAPPQREPAPVQARVPPRVLARVWTYESVVAERGAWRARVGTPTTEPAEFSGYFIVNQGGCCASAGAIVRGSRWDGTGSPYYDVIYGRGNNGCTAQVVGTHDLTFLGMNLEPSFEVLSNTFAAEFAARYPNATSLTTIPCRDGRRAG